jgi:hypothetical protein
MPKMDHEKRARFRVLWKSGVKTEAIAAELGVSYNTVKKYRMRFGLPPRQPRKTPILIPILTEEDTGFALELWREGKDTKTIAGYLHVPEAAVYNSLSNRRGNERVLASGAGTGASEAPRKGRVVQGDGGPIGSDQKRLHRQGRSDGLG